MTAHAKFKVAYVFILTIFLTAACSTENKRSSSLKVVNGLPIDTSKYPEVVLLGTDDGKPLCTGTFITPEAVLTAGHCTKKGDSVDPETYEVKGLTLTIIKLDDPVGKTFSTVASSVAAYRHPQWDKEFPVHLLNKYDIAIVMFPANTSSYVHELADESPKPGDTLTIVGYGIDYVPDMFSFGIDRSSAGIKRLGNNTIQNVVDGMITFFGPTKTTTGDGSLAGSSKGDSGGPMFVDNKLVGVTSGGRLTPLAARPRTSFYTDINSTVSRAFIKQVIAENQN